MLAECAGKGSFPEAGWVSQGRLSITKTREAVRGVKGDKTQRQLQDMMGKKTDVPERQENDVELHVGCVFIA